MKNKALIGGIIALILLALLALFCFWVGKKINDGIRGTQKEEETIEKPAPDVTNPLPEKIETVQQAKEVYLALGNPSEAGENLSIRENFLLVNKAFALSYNDKTGTANWVAWRLTKNDLGNADRQNDFRPDDRLPESFTQIKPTDYSRSGFDRGHFCPSADRTSSPEMNSLTFLMTNMVPQTPDLNRNTWERLESYSRRLVTRTNLDLYIFAGVYGEKKRLKRKLTVPTNTWKIIVAVPQGKGLSAIDEKSLTIAVDFPNNVSLDNDWRKFRTTIRNLEQKTGYNFLSNLPQSLQDKLENRIERQ